MEPIIAEAWVLRGRDGFVRRDDSTGPYSSGGDPCYVRALASATLFASEAEAREYASKYARPDKAPWRTWMIGPLSDSEDVR